MEQRLKRSEGEAGVGTVAFEGEYVFVIPAKAGIHFAVALLWVEEQKSKVKMDPGLTSLRLW